MRYEVGGVSGLTVGESEALLDELVQHLFEQNRMFVPCYPQVFVRVCQREQIRNGIILPGAVQNKVMHEGIVLAAWKPFIQMRKNGVEIPRKSDLNPGDRVLFNHFAGVPIEGYDRDRYRVVRECDFDPVNQGGILATVEYDEAKTRPLARLSEHMDKLGVFRHPEVAQLASYIEENFILIDRNAPSMTLSGV